MEKKGIDQAIWNVTVSYLVSASSRKQAIAIAGYKVNEESVQIERIKLVNDQGLERTFRTEHIEFMMWQDAEYSENYNLYKVTGYIQLLLSSPANTEKGINSFPSRYMMPRSLVKEKPIWVIPTITEPVFLRVLTQSMQWIKTNKDIETYTQVG